MGLIPVRLQKWTSTLDASKDEMEEEYLYGVKKSIVDFVLKDASQINARVID